MRHYKKRGMKLGTDASHTKAIKRGLVSALLANDRIKTTNERAKAIRGDVDRVVTWAKKGDLHSRRLAITKVGDAELVREVFDKAAQGMWADRNGGYTRIMKLGPRKGDNAEVVIIELVTEPVKAKKSSKKTEVKKVKKAEKVEKADEAAETAAEEAADEAAEATDKAAEAADEDAEATDKAAEAADEAAEAAAEEAPAEDTADEAAAEDSSEEEKAE